MAEVFSKQTYAQQLADKLRRAIADGVWQTGSRVPAIHKIADIYGVSPNTAHAALRELEEENILLRKPSGSAYVCDLSEAGNSAVANHRAARSSASALLDASTEPDTAQKFAPIALIGSPDHKSHKRSGDDWMVRIFMAAETELARTGMYTLTRVCSMEDYSDQRLEHIEAQIDHLGSHLAGAVLFSAASKPLHLKVMAKLDRAGVPWVSINRLSDEIVHNFISADNLGAGKTVGRCLVLEDIERVLVLSPDLNRAVSQTRKVTGLFEAYLHHNRSTRGIDFVQTDGAPEEYGYRSTAAYLRSHQPPQVIYTTGDYLAAGALRACREAGLDVPGQIGVIGSTGLDMAQYTTPALSVIPQPMEAMGRAAGEMLIRMIQTGERRLAGRQIPSKLILRDSLKISETTRQKLKEEYLIEENS